jgi:hypothetical protein
MLFSVIKGLFQIVTGVLDYMSRKQLLDAGEAKAIAKQNSDAIKKIEAARIARRDAINNYRMRNK